MVKDAIITIMECRWVIMGFWNCVRVGSGYLLAVVCSILHTQKVSVGPSVQVAVFSTNTSIPGIPWLAFTAEHGLGEDPQVDAVCIFIAVVATILTRVTGFANLKKITRGKRMQAGSLIATNTNTK